MLCHRLETSPQIASMTAPRRRWFRFAFSLRMLFVVMTMFGCWLGWQLAIVRHRVAEIQRMKSSGGKVLSSVPFYASSMFSRWPLDHFETPNISRFRRLLGDRPVGAIQLPSIDLDESECQSIRKTFPELKELSGAPQIIMLGES